VDKAVEALRQAQSIAAQTALQLDRDAGLAAAVDAALMAYAQSSKDEDRALVRCALDLFNQALAGASGESPNERLESTQASLLAATENHPSTRLAQALRLRAGRLDA
jgi:hypothetical protein